MSDSFGIQPDPRASEDDDRPIRSNTAKSASDYERNARAFLGAAGIKFSAARTAENHCPRWDTSEHIHGDEYRITLTRSDGRKPQRMQSRFWNSFEDARHSIDPTPYDFLAAITKYDPGSFSDFCSDFGYDEDSRQAESTYRAVVREWEKVQRFFTPDELEKAQEIA